MLRYFHHLLTLLILATSSSQWPGVNADETVTLDLGSMINGNFQVGSSGNQGSTYQTTVTPGGGGVYHGTISSGTPPPDIQGYKSFILNDEEDLFFDLSAKLYHNGQTVNFERFEGYVSLFLYD